MMEHGTITDVRYQDGVPVCAVRIHGRLNNEDRHVPVMRMHHGMFLVPKNGQTVQIAKIGDQRFIIGVLDTGGDYANPDLSEGELAFMFDDETKLTFTQNDNGDFDVNVEASGKVYIGGIPFEDHSHEYEDATTETTTTKTTDPPS